jgi:hypothetical protein
MKKGLLFSLSGISLALLFLWFNSTAEITYGPGIMAPDTPVQTTSSLSSPFEFNGYQITPLAQFEAHARVLSRKYYSRGREADLSPVDLALGWGPMSDEANLNHIRIRQSMRFYFWNVDRFPIPRSEIEHNSANMHFIPSNNLVKKELKKVRKGDIVSFSGYLIRANGQDGWQWVSSLTRTDTGNGACELIFIESFEIVTPDL